MGPCSRRKRSTDLMFSNARHAGGDYSAAANAEGFTRHDGDGQSSEIEKSK